MKRHHLSEIYQFLGFDPRDITRSNERCRILEYCENILSNVSQHNLDTQNW